jgi:hypothetical protein
MELEIVKQINIDKKKSESIGEFFYNRDENSIAFDGPWLFPVQLKITDWKKIQITPAFRILPTILRGFLNPDIICRELNLIELVQQNKLLLHASCVKLNNKGILNMGFPNSGKTYETYYSLSVGGLLISEEYTIIDNGIAYPYRSIVRSCLSKITIEDCKIKTTLLERSQLFLNTIRAKLIPFLFEPVIWKEFLVSGKSTQINEIRIKGQTIEDNLYEKLVLLTENEFPFMSEYILEAYAFMNGFNLSGIQNRQRWLLWEFVKNLVMHNDI